MSQPNPSFLLSAGVAQAVECGLAAAFGNTTLVRVPLSAYFFR